MHAYHRLRMTVVVICLSGLFPALAWAGDPEEDAKTAIRKLIEKFNSSYKLENGPEVVGEVISDTAFTFVRQAGGEEPQARVLNKAGYLEAFSKYVWKKNLRKHEHHIDSLNIIGGIAYELGTITDVSEDGVEARGEVFNIFAREQGEWKLVFSTTPDYFKGRGPQGVTDEDDLKELARKFVATFNSKDATPFEEFEKMLAGDVTAIQSDGTMLDGRSEVVKYYREHVERLRKSFQQTEITWNRMEVKLLGGGAVVRGKITLSATKKEGDDAVRHTEWETLVFRKTTTGWQITEEHSSAVKAAEGK